MSEIIDCPVCGDTVEEHIAQAGEERIRADERERCIDEVLVAIDIWAGEIQLNPELVAVIKAIKAEDKAITDYESISETGEK